MKEGKNHLRMDPIWKSVWLEFGDGSYGPKATSISEMMQILNYYYSIDVLSDCEYQVFRLMLRIRCRWLPPGVSIRTIAATALRLSIHSTKN